MTSVIKYCVYVCENYIKFILILTERRDLKNFDSPQMFIITSFTDRLGHLNYRSMLLWQALYKYGTKKWPLLPKYWTREW